MTRKKLTFKAPNDTVHLKGAAGRENSATHLLGPGLPDALLQAADPPLQLQVGFLQLPDLLHQLADVLQITQA